MRHSRSTTDSMTIGFLGSISPEKGVNYLIQAYCSLPQKIQSQITLHIAGSLLNNNRHFWEPLQKQTEGKSVIWHGEIVDQEKENFFQTIELLVIPSLFDSAPLVLLEGYREGLPIIVSEDVGNKTYIDQENGWVVETRNAEALAHAFLDAFARRHEFSQMGRVSRQRFLERGNWDIGTTAVLKMLDEVFQFYSSKKQ